METSLNDAAMNFMMVSNDASLYAAVAQAIEGRSVRLRHEPFCAEVMQTLSADPPHVVLLDAATADFDAADICQAIRDDYSLQNLEILYLSADDSTAGRISAFNAGADDYLTKPLYVDELLSKLAIALRRKQRHDQLNSFAQMASQTAMMAMTNAGELGVLLQFLKRSFECHDYQALGTAIVEAVAQYDLDATVQIRTEGGDCHSAARGGDVAPLAEAIIGRLKDQGRIFDFNNRSVFNYPHLSLLIKDMPSHDLERYGRMKDHMAMLAEGAEARVLAIQAEVELAQKKDALEILLASTHSTLAKIEHTYQQHRMASTEIVENLMGGLEQLFLLLGLTEAQELSLYELVTEAVEKSMALYDAGLKTDALFDDILRLLDHFQNEKA